MRCGNSFDDLFQANCPTTPLGHLFQQPFSISVSPNTVSRSWSLGQPHVPISIISKHPICILIIISFKKSYLDMFESGLRLSDAFSVSWTKCNLLPSKCKSNKSKFQDKIKCRHNLNDANLRWFKSSLSKFSGQHVNLCSKHKLWTWHSRMHEITLTDSFYHCSHADIGS